MAVENPNWREWQQARGGAAGPPGPTGPAGPPGPAPSGTANLFVATPNGSTGTAALRAIVEADLPASSQAGVFGITIDGGVTQPTTGLKGYLTVPYSCTITGWTIIGDQSGSASMDIWYVAGSGAPPTAPNIPNSGNKISASAPVSLSSAQSASGGSSAISTWTKSLAQWGTIGFNLSSVTTCLRLTIQLEVTRT